MVYLARQSMPWRINFFKNEVNYENAYFHFINLGLTWRF